MVIDPDGEHICSSVRDSKIYEIYVTPPQNEPVIFVDNFSDGDYKKKSER